MSIFDAEFPVAATITDTRTGRSWTVQYQSVADAERMAKTLPSIGCTLAIQEPTA